ncbi:MAG: nuclear transport factor 2 family protein [Xanthobacteraceae bacterium]|nr:nuclear transport factor 2 family protein [Xanthobacteraceae bacterium]
MATTSKQKAGTQGAGTAQPVDFDALMQANLVRVFGERDVERRRAALQELYAEDATLYEPQAVAPGREAISSAVDALLAGLPPDFVFAPAGQAQGHNGVGRLFWRAGPPAGPVAITGTDVAHVEGGRIKSLHVFLDPVPR